jgi:SAM-dependent methyltransferase
MKPTLKPEGIIEHIALWGNLGPLPVAEAMFGMIICRVIMAGVRLGIYEELSVGSATAREIASRKGLNAQGAEHLLDCLCAAGHLVRKSDRYAITARAKKWLAPASPTYIGAFLEFNYDQWEWWSNLENVVKTGEGFEIHGFGAEDPRWERYITAMHQLARLSAPEVAQKLRLPPNPKKLVDLAGAHGWFAAELCKRHPDLQATVLDLPGSVKIGKRIIAEARLSERVRHFEGDILKDELDGPFDGALAFQIIHHLTPEQNVALFRKVHAALNPGGVLAILDYFAPPPGHKPDTASFLGLHFFLTSSAATYSVEQLKAWLKEAGFSAVRKIRLQRLPIQVLYEAKK